MGNINPYSSTYRAAARQILQEMRERAEKECVSAGQVAESWPCEYKMFPVSENIVEGVLYMPRALPAVRLFQVIAREVPKTGEDSSKTSDDQSNTDGCEEFELEINSFAAVSPTIYSLSQMYLERGAEYMFTCSCGHEILRVVDHSCEDDDSDDGAVDDNNPPRTAEEYRRFLLNNPAEQNYECPACGQQPNRRY